MSLFVSHLGLLTRTDRGLITIFKILSSFPSLTAEIVIDLVQVC